MHLTRFSLLPEIAEDADVAGLTRVSLIFTCTKLSGFSLSELDEGHIEGGGVTGSVEDAGLATEFSFCGRESLFPTTPTPLI